MRKENLLQTWIDTDNQLSKILNEIETSCHSENEKARMAFHRLAETYNLSKYPDDVLNRETIQVTDFHLYEPISMYEVLEIGRAHV
jgi:hypothetical protein